MALGEFGQVIPSTEKETAHVQAVQSRKNALDKCRSACGDLLTIDPRSKTKNEERLETAKQWINDAASIVILGYGFDENNNDRLDLPRSLYYDEKNHNLKRVMFTNYEDRLRVNKSASRLALRRPNAFATHAPETGGSRTYEKSTRNVYDALALDFDL